mmetsp:Transcript_11893/g.28182  ORF Transcript_11893/g.28182 Transcript_11893/m.28182 type:complete len:439 (+) Transcript_11893:170-1486(+)
MSSDNTLIKSVDKKRITLSWALFVLSVVLCVGKPNFAGAFVQTKLSPGSKHNEFASRGFTTGGGSKLPEPSPIVGRGSSSNQRQSTELYSFMGSDGGLFGIGTPELFTIVLIGYFILGPSDLYKLVKEIGKFIQNFQSFAAEATASLENNMESQLQLEEIRKAQRELNDAFSFRRSINTEADSDPFAVNAQTPRQDDATASLTSESEYDLSTTATAGATVAPKKRKMRRVKKKKTVSTESTVASEVSEKPVEASKDNVALGAMTNNQKLANDVPPTLDIDDELMAAENKAMESIYGSNDDLKLEDKETSNLTAQIREERIGRLERSQGINDDAVSSAEQSRFQQQMSGDWNQQIVENSDKLEPLAEVMNLLAVLEEEKVAADKRLQEEFKAREVNEEKFYLEKRKVLEEASASVQAQAYSGDLSTATASTVTNSSGTL